MGRNLYARLVAYKAGGDRIGVLPQPSSWQALVEFDESGSLTFDYAAGAVGGDITTRALTDGTEIAVEVSDGGEWTEPPSMRYLVVKREGDQTDPTGTVTFTCVSYGWLLNKIRNLNTDAVETDGDNKGQRPFLSANAGTIIRTFLQENAERGGAAANIDAGFDTGKDSSGTAWSRVQTLHYSIGITLKTAMDSMVQAAVIDWDTSGRTLRVWNADNTQRSRDLSRKVIVQLARDVTSGPFEETIEDTASHILVTGDNGLVFTEDNPATPAPWGKWESYVSQGGVSDEGTAKAFMQSTLEQASRVRGSYTRGLLVSDANHLPFIDYQPGDWITAPTVNHGEKVRVRQLKLNLDNTNGAQKITCSVTLNDALTDPDVRQNKKLNGISGGAALAGSESSRPAPAQDHRVPKAPEGLVLSSDAYVDDQGNALGVVYARWGEVTQATDGTAIDIDSYRMEWRYGDEADHWRFAGLTVDETISWGGVDCGRTVVVRVRAIPTYSDKPGEWSGTVQVTVESDVTPPSIPSMPVLESELGVVRVRSDGLNHVGGGFEPDTAYLAVGRSASNGNWTGVGRIPVGGMWTDIGLSMGQTYWYALRAVDRSGNASGWSQGASIRVAPAVTQDELNDLAERVTNSEEVSKDQAQQIAETQKQLTSQAGQIADNKQAAADAQAQAQKVATDLAAANRDLAQAQKDIAANASAVQQTNQTVSQVQSDLTGTKNDLNGVKTDLTGVKTGLDKAQSDLTQVRTDLTEANKELDSVGKTASDAASKAQQAYTAATGAQKTADGLHNIFKGWQDPTTMSGVAVKTGDMWYRTQQFWTTSQGEPDNSPSLCANFYTYSQGERDNSPSVLVPLESEVVEVLTWDGEQWNQFNLVASNVIATGSVIGDLIAANTITAGHLSAGSVTTDKLVSLAVTADKLAANSVTAGKIAALAVTADKLAANAVTAGKIAANAVTAGTIAAGAVTTDKLAALSVTAAKIAALTITGDKIAANAISADKITANAVTSAKIAANAVTADKIAANAISAGKIAAGAIDGMTITGAIIQTSGTANRGIKITSGGLTAYNSSGGTVTTINASSGQITTSGPVISGGSVSGTTVTGGILQTSATANRGVKITSSGLAAYDGSGNAKTVIDANTGRITTDGAVISNGGLTSPTITGGVITGALFRSSESAYPRFELSGTDLDMWDSARNHTVHLDGDGETSWLTGTFQTAVSGKRVLIDPDFHTSIVGDPGNTQTGVGINFVPDGAYARAPYIGTEFEDSDRGLISTICLNGGMRTDGSGGANTGFGSFMRLGQYRNGGTESAEIYATTKTDYLEQSADTSRREWYTALRMHNRSGNGSYAQLYAHKPGNRYANVYAWANDSNNSGRTYAGIEAHDPNGGVGIQACIDTGYLHLGGYLGGFTGRATVQALNWRWGNGMGHGQTAGPSTYTFGNPAKYGAYNGVANADVPFGSIFAHVCNTGSASRGQVMGFNAGTANYTGDVYCSVVSWLRA